MRAGLLAPNLEPLARTMPLRDLSERTARQREQTLNKARVVPSYERAIIGIVLLLAFVALFEVLNALLPARSPRSGVSGPATQDTNLSETLQARVTKAAEEESTSAADAGGAQRPHQRLELLVTRGSLKGQQIVVTPGSLTMAGAATHYRVGDEVMVEHTHGPQGDHFVITDFVRLKPLLWLGLAFALSTLAVGRWKGFYSLIATAFSFVVIMHFILPQILAGRDPVLVTVIGSIILMGCTIYVVYGWQMQTHAAAGGLFLSLILTAFLAALFVNWSRLHGLSADEATFLMMESDTPIDFRGLLLSGIIIGAVGVLYDVAVTQASAIFRMTEIDPHLGWRDLFRYGMKIGRDHIAGMVNTLVLAYVGASLPFLLLFTLYAEPFLLTVNRAFIAEEIVRTLVGSLGLIATVPLTSLLASWLASSRSTVSNTALAETSAPPNSKTHPG